MANTVNAPAKWATETNLQTHNNIWRRFLTAADEQAKNLTFWFLFSLVLQGVFFLPIPAFLMFYYNAPVIVLITTLTFFFASIIAGMGGSGIRVLLGIFAASVI